MKTRIFASVFLSLFIYTTSYSQKPKLIVGIVVDQMRYDYISRYWSKFGDNGFKRLVTEGYFCKNTNYNYVPTYTAPGHASIYTGTTPSSHGIIANNWYDRESNTMVYCVDDKSVNALGGDTKAGQMSPRKLLNTTIGDQLNLSDNFQSKVIGIALKDRGAILPAGKSGKAAYWYDGSTGNWISSTYYMKALPQWVTEFNNRAVAKRFLESTWNTLLPIEQYTESTPDDSPYERPFTGLTKATFPYVLPELMAANEKLNMIRSTPYGNTFTKDFAIETIKAENMGKGNASDLIAISFSSTDYIGHQFGPNSVEVEDTYLRLDQDLAELLKFLDEWVGKNNVLVFLTADHGAAENPTYLKDHSISSGTFNEYELKGKLKKAMAKEFSDSLVLSVSNQQVFLDQKAISLKTLKADKIENSIVDFLLKENGIANAFPEYNLVNKEYAEGIESVIKNGYHVKRSGDVMINYLPYWMDSEVKFGTTHGSPYEYDTHVPLIFYGYTIKPGSTSEKINITDIAPTICNLLNIEVPNGTSGKPILQLIR